MELSDENIQTLSNYLQQTLNPVVDIRRPAEKFLESVELNQNYPLLLLHLVDKQNVDITIRVAGAVAFKNYIKRNWPVNEDGVDRIHIQDREAVKKLIVSLMLHSPDAIQKQFSDSIYIIGSHDFPEKWPNLITEMVEKFSSGEFSVVNGVLHTAHSLFKRYRHEFKSQKLWTEIKHVLDNFAKPFTDLFQQLMSLRESHVNNPEGLKVIYSSLVITCKVFYSLNFQDLPEHFEDNMNVWMPHFYNLLTEDVKCLQTDDEEEPGLLEKLKSQICENISLYAQKYGEEFEPFLSNFVTAVWNLLISSGSQAKYDLLVSAALQFLTVVAERPQHRHLFEDPVVLSNICEKVVIPNMEFRSSDEELFEDNAEEYIRRDIEGSDVDTRRRAACDLVQALSRYYEEKMMEIFGRYVQVMLQTYSENPLQNWRSKDAALYLVTSLVSKGQTQRHGVTQTSQLVNVMEFANQHILPELQGDQINNVPVLKADAIKYVMIFRSVLPKETVVGTLPQLVKFLLANSQVVHTYAAYAIEKILAMSTGGQPVVRSEELAPIAQDLLKNLFTALTFPSSEENEYVMKAIMRSFLILQQRVVPYLEELLPKLTQKLIIVARNPKKPHFNHYLFETLCISIRCVCSDNSVAVSSFEATLFPIFQEILQQDIQEFIPYIFQILSQLLNQHSKGGIPEPYLALFPCLLSPVLWERPGNIHPLVKLLQVYLKVGSDMILASNKLNELFGVFQKLIASKLNDHEGFYLMQTIIECIPLATLTPYMKQIFMLLFQRLSSSKTTKYIKGLLVFFAFYSIKYGVPELINIIDNIQQQMFGMVIERLMLPDIQKISGSVERKIMGVGLVKLLCESPELLSGCYSQYWAQLLQVLIALIELPEDETTHPEDHFIEVEDTPGYQPVYSQLIYAFNKEKDTLESVVDVGDVRAYLAQNLAKLSQVYPGRISTMIAPLGDIEKGHLKNYLDAAHIQLS